MIEKREQIRRKRLLIQVARLYYEEGHSQNDIAKIVGLSRPYISKLLVEAKEQGIVKIEIVDDLDEESLLEQKLRDYFQLRKVIIVPKTSTKDPITAVGEAAAAYLESILKEGDVIGYSWGETVYSCAKALSINSNRKNITTVQMCGGISNTKKNVYVSEISHEFSKKLNSTGYLLPFPAIVNSSDVKEVLSHERTMEEALQYASRMNISIVTTGRFDAQSAVARAGYLKPKEMHALEKSGVVGDICTHFVNENGEIASPSLDSRTIAIPYEILRRIDTRIGISIGEHKVNSLLAALKGHAINVLITDEQTVSLLRETNSDIFE